MTPYVQAWSMNVYDINKGGLQRGVLDEDRTRIVNEVM